MPGVLYMLMVLFVAAVVMQLAWPPLVSVASLPGTVIHLATRRTQMRNAGIVFGCVLAFTGQLVLFASAAAYVVHIARYLVNDANGWKWVIWPMAFVGTAIILATGGKDAAKSVAEQPDLRYNPMHLVVGLSWVSGIVTFVAVAIFPDTFAPLWSWLPIW